MYKKKKKKKKKKRVGRKESKQAKTRAEEEEEDEYVGWRRGKNFYFLFWLDIFPPKLVKLGLV